MNKCRFPSAIADRDFLRALIAGAALCLGPVALAQAPRGDAAIGTADYRAHCARCHGPGGKGDGRIMDMQNRRLPDLTRLSMRNNGVFPTARVMEIIDGTRVIVIHGTSGMPAWGKTLREEASRQCASSGCDPETVVGERLRALAAAIESFQAK